MFVATQTYVVSDCVKYLTPFIHDFRKDNEIYNRVARFSTFFSDRLGTNGISCVPMPVKEPYNLFDLG